MWGYIAINSDGQSNEILNMLIKWKLVNQSDKVIMIILSVYLGLKYSSEHKELLKSFDFNIKSIFHWAIQ